MLSGLLLNRFKLIVCRRVACIFLIIAIAQLLFAIRDSALQLSVVVRISNFSIYWGSSGHPCLLGTRCRAFPSVLHKVNRRTPSPPSCRDNSQGKLPDSSATFPIVALSKPQYNTIKIEIMQEFSPKKIGFFICFYKTVQLDAK